jgi:hypothetical protein
MKQFHPYGQDGLAQPLDEAAPVRLLPGAAEVVAGDSRRGIEVYAFEREAGHWRLFSQAFDEPWRLLARIHEDRLPAEPLDAAADVLTDLWSLRHAGRLRFVRGLEFGALGRLHWQRIEAAATPPAPLEQALRAEGFEVRAIPGPVGTTEHVLLLRRA